MLKPLNSNVILKREKAQTTTSSGIVLVSPKESASNQAVVVAVGPKCDDLLQENQTVVFKEYSGTKFKVEDDEYIIIDEEDILAIVEWEA